MWRVRRASRLIWPSVVAFGVVVGVWWLLSATGAVPVRDLPSPATVGHKLVHRIATGKFPSEALHSLIRLGFGMVVAVVIGTFVGVAMAASRAFQRGVGSLVTGLQAMPPIAWLPLAALWFGFNEKAVVFVIGIVIDMAFAALDRRVRAKRGLTAMTVQREATAA